MGTVYAIANQKGGVGKTTTAVNVAACIAEAGYQTLLVDLDPQCNATVGLGLPKDLGPERLRRASAASASLADAAAADRRSRASALVPATPDLAGANVELPRAARLGDAPARRARRRCASASLFTLLDCPPSLGPLTVNALVAADRVIVPVQTEYFALEGLAGLLDTLGLDPARAQPAADGRRACSLTMHDGRTRLAQDVEREVREHFPELVFDTVIPRNVRVGEAPSFGRAGDPPRSRTAPARTPTSSSPRRCARAAWLEHAAARDGPRPGRDPARGSEPTRTSRAARAAGRADRARTRASRAGASTRTRSTRSPSRSRARGVLQPVARPPGRPAARYELVAGERRWRAAQLAGLETVPALVRAARRRASALELALVENMAREDLNPVEEARACAALVEELGLTREEVGRRVGRSRVAVSNLIRLLDLPDEALELLEAGELTEGHGRALLLADGPRRAAGASPATPRAGLVGARDRGAAPAAAGGAAPPRRATPVGAAPRPGGGDRAPPRTRSSAALGRDVRVRAARRRAAGSSCASTIARRGARAGRVAAARAEREPDRAALHRPPRGRLAQSVRARL